MPLSTTMYSVTITNGNSSNPPPKDGFVDNKRIENFNISLATTPSGLTYALCKAKRRANRRYRYIVDQLSMISNSYIVDYTITSDSTIKTEATSFAFQVIVEHGDASLITADELNPGTFLTSSDCIKRCVARALYFDLFEHIDVVDPTSAISMPSTSTNVPRYGTRLIPLEIGSYATSLSNAETMIAVTNVTP